MTHNDHIHFTYTPPTLSTYAQGGRVYARPVNNNTWTFIGYIDDIQPKMRRRQTW